MSLPYEIFIASSDDISGIIEINEESNMPEGWSYNSLLYEIAGENKHYFTAKNDDEILGYIGYAQILDESHIMNIAVRKSARRQGIGEALMKKAFADAQNRGISAMTLEVRASNTPARKLYEKLGFETAGLRKNFYSDKEAAAILWKYF